MMYIIVAELVGIITQVVYAPVCYQLFYNITVGIELEKNWMFSWIP